MTILEVRNGYRLEKIGKMYQVIHIASDISEGYVYTERKAQNLLTRVAGE